MPEAAIDWRFVGIKARAKVAYILYSALSRGAARPLPAAFIICERLDLNYPAVWSDESPWVRYLLLYPRAYLDNYRSIHASRFYLVLARLKGVDG